MAKGLQKALQQQPEDDSKRSPRPQDLIRLYDIILQVTLEDWGSRACPSQTQNDLALRSEGAGTSSSC